MQVKDLLVNEIISHNEIVSIWEDIDKHSSREVWHGMAHEMPPHIMNLTFKRIFGVIPECLTKADTVNILIRSEIETNKWVNDSNYNFEVGM